MTKKVLFLVICILKQTKRRLSKKMQRKIIKMEFKIIEMSFIFLFIK